jgi:hypothetical protein
VAVRILNAFLSVSLLSACLCARLAQVVNARQLLAVSALEQAIVCGTDHEDTLGKLDKLMEDGNVRLKTDR